MCSELLYIAPAQVCYGLCNDFALTGGRGSCAHAGPQRAARDDQQGSRSEAERGRAAPSEGGS